MGLLLLTIASVSNVIVDDCDRGAPVDKTHPILAVGWF